MVTKNNTITEGPFDTLQRSSASIHMTLISIIQGAVLSYLAVVLADNFRDLDLPRWLAVGLAFLTMVGTWQEAIMMAHITLGVFRFRDSLLFFCLGGAQFMVVRALLPDMPYSYIFFSGALYLLVSEITLLNQYKGMQTKGPYQEVLSVVKMQLRSKGRFLILPIFCTLLAGVLLLFIHNIWLTVALVAVNLLAQILSLRQISVVYHFENRLNVTGHFEKIMKVC